jgi:putative phage-type endonuclease
MTDDERKAWLEERRNYLGASEAAAALALSPHETPIDLWARKIGLSRPRPSTVAMELGNAAEPIVLARYARRTGAMLRAPGTRSHPTEGWLRATLDSIADEARNVQAKFVPHARDQWGPDGSGAEGVPRHYLVQVAIEMEVAQLNETDVAALILGEEEPRIYRVERDPELGALLVGQLREWWATYVEPRNPDLYPEGVVPREIIAARFPAPRRPLAEATPRVIELARGYDQARAVEAQAKAEKERLGDLLCAAIADGEGFGGTWGNATWRPDKTGKPSWKSIAAELGAPPDLVAKHTSEPQRVLRVTIKETP